MSSSLKTRIQRLERQMQSEDCETNAEQQLRRRLQAARERIARNRRRENETSQKGEKAA